MSNTEPTTTRPLPDGWRGGQECRCLWPSPHHNPNDDHCVRCGEASFQDEVLRPYPPYGLMHSSCIGNAKLRGEIVEPTTTRLSREQLEDISGEFVESLYQRCKDYPYNTRYCCSYHEGMQDGIEIGLRQYRADALAYRTALEQIRDMLGDKTKSDSQLMFDMHAIAADALRGLS